MNRTVLAVIPARGGSKGVKRKNIRSVGGMPLIYWSIKAAKESLLITDFVVSTDDEEIAKIAKSFGAEVFLRDSLLAEDKTPMLPVLQNVCERYEEETGKIDALVLLQPTAPLRDGNDIDSAISEFNGNESNDSLVSVYLLEDCHPSRMYRIIDGKLDKFYQEPPGALRQDLEDVYHRNGAIYIASRELLMREGRLTCDRPLPFVMEKAKSANIDDEQDLQIADFLLSASLKSLKENEEQS